MDAKMAARLAALCAKQAEVAAGMQSIRRLQARLKARHGQAAAAAQRTDTGSERAAEVANAEIAAELRDAERENEARIAGRRSEIRPE